MSDASWDADRGRKVRFDTTSRKILLEGYRRVSFDWDSGNLQRTCAIGDTILNLTSSDRHVGKSVEVRFAGLQELKDYVASNASEHLYSISSRSARVRVTIDADKLTYQVRRVR